MNWITGILIVPWPIVSWTASIRLSPPSMSNETPPEATPEVTGVSMAAVTLIGALTVPSV